MIVLHMLIGWMTTITSKTMKEYCREACRKIFAALKQDFRQAR